MKTGDVIKPVLLNSYALYPRSDGEVLIVNLDIQPGLQSMYVQTELCFQNHCICGNIINVKDIHWH